MGLVALRQGHFKSRCLAPFWTTGFANVICDWVAVLDAEEAVLLELAHQVVVHVAAQAHRKLVVRRMLDALRYLDSRCVLHPPQI